MKVLEKIVNKSVGNYLKGMAYAAGIGLAVLCSSCSVNSKYGVLPKIRTGSFFGSAINFLSLERLGIHNFSEHNGMALTCNAGFIDIAHFRNAADLTKYFSEKTFLHLKNNETEFSFKLKEPSRYYVKIDYPKNWKNLTEEKKEIIAKDVSIGFGEYFAYTGVTWHEILTWFGYTWMGVISEFPSAFSWEDGFSNLLGSYIGAKALRDSEHEFEEAVTLAFKKELEKLNVQPRHIAKRADKIVRGKWYSGWIPFIDVKKRNFDIGEDGFVTPFVVSGISECENAEPVSYPVPNLDVLFKYGFSMKFEIEPHEFQKGKILDIVYQDRREKKRIEPDKHFAKIMDYIKKDAIKRYGVNVDVP